MSAGEVLYIVLLGVVLVFAMDVFGLWEPLAKKINEWMFYEDTKTKKRDPIKSDSCRYGHHNRCLVQINRALQCECSCHGERPHRA